MQLNIALLGFGNVGRALAELIIRKQDTLRQSFNTNLRIVGICTHSHGRAVNPNGISLRKALDFVASNSSLDAIHEGTSLSNSEQFLVECPADLIFESIPTNPEDGQPALGYARYILDKRIHLVTANKGPVAFGYHELSELAAENDVGFFFESTVMDGAPVIAVGREGLPGSQINRVRGIFNSTTNYILTRMESEKLTFEQALRESQSIGIAEADPSLDIDGWDAAIKTVILANVLMGANLRPADVDRRGIRDITLDAVREAAAAGQRIKLLCEAVRGETKVSAHVKPQRVPINSTLAGIVGTTSLVDFESDTLSQLTLIEHNPGPDTTAYGMLADMLNIVRGRHRTQQDR